MRKAKRIVLIIIVFVMVLSVAAIGYYKMLDKENGHMGKSNDDVTKKQEAKLGSQQKEKLSIFSQKDSGRVKLKNDEKNLNVKEHSSISLKNKRIEENNAKKESTLSKDIVPQNNNLRQRVKVSINKAVQYSNYYYRQRDYQGLLDWPVTALFASGENLEEDSKKKALAWREKEIKEEMDFDLQRATDYQRTIIGAISAGKDPKNFAGKDLLNAIKKSQLPNGKFADTIDQGGEKLVNAHIWAIICLYAAGEEVPHKEKAYKWLVEHQNTDGGFSISTDIDTSDIDMTGMTLIAFGGLGKTSSDSNVEKALKYISSQQLENGGFQIWGVENSETAAAIVQGMIAVGVDPVSKRWTKKDGKNPIDFIISFQQDDGSFAHDRTSGMDAASTYKALMALSDFYNNKSVFKMLREKILGGKND